MIDNKEQYGFEGLDIKGITIHNTGNSLSAQENYDLLSTLATSQGTHYFVDEKEILEFMPLDWCVYHTGMANDWACKHTIAIEICRSQSTADLYLKAQDNAIKLIKKLMRKYKLKSNNIYFHNDFNKTTYCPHKILDLYKTRKEFIRRYF